MNETDALLDQIRAVQVPEVSLIPAYGWWMVAVVILALIYIIHRCSKFYASRRWQREARSELQRIRTQTPNTSVAQTLADTSRLARRVLLVARPRVEVASLQGNAWLDMLDQVCRKPLFSSGFGRLLEVGPYQREPAVSPADLDALFEAMDDLISASGKHKLERAAT